MDTLFFYISKIIWFFLKPENVLIFLFLICIVLFALKKDRLAKKFFVANSIFILLIAFIPIGQWLLHPLETRFNTSPHLPENISGIILLGGSFSPQISHQWNRPQTNEVADRIFSFLELIHKYPNAKAVFSGGTASLNSKSATEAFYAKKLFKQLGIKEGRIFYDNKAKNTYQNVLYSKQLVDPKPNENWIVVTSAFHLPRTVGIFCQLNWKIIPYPADFHSLKDYSLISLNFRGHLKQIKLALHEWLGLIAYYVTGKTYQLFPQQCN